MAIKERLRIHQEIERQNAEKLRKWKEGIKNEHNANEG